MVDGQRYACVKGRQVRSPSQASLPCLLVHMTLCQHLLASNLLCPALHRSQCLCIATVQVLLFGKLGNLLTGGGLIPGEANTPFDVIGMYASTTCIGTV